MTACCAISGSTAAKLGSRLARAFGAKPRLSGPGNCRRAPDRAGWGGCLYGTHDPISLYSPAPPSGARQSLPPWHVPRPGFLLARSSAARSGLQRSVLVLGQDDRGLLPAVLRGASAAAQDGGLPRLAPGGRGRGFPPLQTLQAARLAGRVGPQQAGGARLCAV